MVNDLPLSKKPGRAVTSAAAFFSLIPDLENIISFEFCAELQYRYFLQKYLASMPKVKCIRTGSKNKHCLSDHLKWYPNASGGSTTNL